MSIFKKLFAWFAGITASIKSFWEKQVLPIEQDAVLKGIEIVQIVKTNLDKTPDIVFQLLQSKYPSISREKLEGILNEAASKLNLIDDTVQPDIYSTIKKLQEYLSKQTGNSWVLALNQLASIIAIIISPETSLVQKIGLVLQFVYDNIVNVK